MLKYLSESAHPILDPSASMQCEAFENLCLEAFDSSIVGIVLEVILFAYSFVGIADVADEHLTTGLETLCHRWQVGEDVAGASFLALGSAAPEIVVAAVSTAKSSLARKDKSACFASSLGISSIIGSGMMAFTLIPGLCAMSVSEPMKLKRRPFARDASFYLASLSLLFVTISNHHVYLHHAAAMLVLYAAYISVMAFGSRLRKYSNTPSKCGQANVEKVLMQHGNNDPGTSDEDDEEPSLIRGLFFAPFQPMCRLISLTCPKCQVGSPTEALFGITLVSAFIWLAILSTVLSATITRWGTLLNIPASGMGMFVIAVGAQIPDTVQAVAVARKGHGSMAVASAVGSQVINVLVGLGVPWFVTASAGVPIIMPEDDGVQLLEMAVLLMYCCVAIYVVALLGPTITTWGGAGHAELGKTQGLLFFAVYGIVVLLFASQMVEKK